MMETETSNTKRWLLTGGLVVFGTLALITLLKRLVKGGSPVTLKDPNEKVRLKLIEKEEVSHDTRRFRFALPSSKHCLGLPIGTHVYMSAVVENKLVVRPYTPVSSDDDLGYTDFVIKVYFKNVHPNFPDGGKLSQYLNNMEVGSSIDVRGPSGLCVYQGNGMFDVKPDKKSPAKKKQASKVAMIAGGTGITPMLQFIRAVFKDPSDSTQLYLIFANQTEEDILLREELEELKEKYPSRFQLHYTLDRPPQDWSFSKGFISAEMIEANLPTPADDVFVIMCGPPPMINFACIPNLDKLGYSPRMRFSY